MGASSSRAWASAATTCLSWFRREHTPRKKSRTIPCQRMFDPYNAPSLTGVTLKGSEALAASQLFKNKRSSNLCGRLCWKVVSGEGNISTSDLYRFICIQLFLR